ncbi:COG1399 Predicted metal-binding, possibly nucleic acid-binding protein [Spirosomataceae bacterium]
MQPFCKKVNKVISDFDINIHGLENKNYEYQFEGSDSFFEHFVQDIVERGDFKVKLVLEKTSTLLRLRFDIDADLRLVCDRSLEEFTENFIIHETHIYKYGEISQEMSDEMEVIPFGTPKINVADLISDYILLSVPMKNLHPRFRAEDDEDEDGIMVYLDPNAERPETDTSTDPRWAALLNLKNLEEQ